MYSESVTAWPLKAEDPTGIPIAFLSSGRVLDGVPGLLDAGGVSEPSVYSEGW